jgi:hypothetical protein
MIYSLKKLIRSDSDLDKFKNRFITNLVGHFMLKKQYSLNLMVTHFDHNVLTELLKKTCINYIELELNKEYEEYMLKSLKVIHEGFLKFRFYQFVDDLFKNFYAMDSVLLNTSYFEHVKSIIVSIHRKLNAEVAHKDVLLFAGIGSNDLNVSIIHEDYNKMCMKLNNDVSYLSLHYKYLSRFIEHMDCMRMVSHRKLRRTNAGVFLYSEFGYNFQCDELIGIYN